MVRPSPVHPGRGDGLFEDFRVGVRVLHQCLLPRVPGERTAQDVQDLGLHGHDGADSALFCFEIHGKAVRSPVWQHRSVGIHHPGTTVGNHDVLP